MRNINFSNFTVSNNSPFFLIAGPCQVESLDHSLYMAESLIKITDELKIPLIYKSSFDKANRTSNNSKRGIGLEESLNIFSEIKKQFGCLITTDVHKEKHCAAVAEIADLIQIPAFLCRQTDLLEAAAATAKPINVKKGQFLAPWDMKNVYLKLTSFGANDVMLCDRGTSFGYNTLISDMRGLSIMAETGCPVIFDATHSVQQPSVHGGVSGGERKYVETLARAALSVGVAGVFIEVHQDPDNAPSDGPCMVELHNLKSILSRLKAYDELTKSWS